MRIKVKCAVFMPANLIVNESRRFYTPKTSHFTVFRDFFKTQLLRVKRNCRKRNLRNSWFLKILVTKNSCDYLTRESRVWEREETLFCFLFEIVWDATPSGDGKQTRLRLLPQPHPHSKAHLICNQVKAQSWTLIKLAGPVEIPNSIFMETGKWDQCCQICRIRKIKPRLTLKVTNRVALLRIGIISRTIHNIYYLRDMIG